MPLRYVQEYLRANARAAFSALTSLPMHSTDLEELLQRLLAMIGQQVDQTQQIADRVQALERTTSQTLTGEQHQVRDSRSWCEEWQERTAIPALQRSRAASHSLNHDRGTPAHAACVSGVPAFDHALALPAGHELHHRLQSFTTNKVFDR